MHGAVCRVLSVESDALKALSVLWRRLALMLRSTLPSTLTAVAVNVRICPNGNSLLLPKMRVTFSVGPSCRRPSLSAVCLQLFRILLSTADSPAFLQSGIGIVVCIFIRLRLFFTSAIYYFPPPLLIPLLSRHPAAWHAGQSESGASVPLYSPLAASRYRPPLLSLFSFHTPCVEQVRVSACARAR